MRLTTFSDYALRVLMYAASARGRLVTIDETARLYGISRTHLMKVVSRLARAGYIEGVRGRAGGFTLKRPPEDVALGQLLRATEPDFALVACFAGDRCAIAAPCGLPRILNQALDAFVDTLDQFTLADIALPDGDFARLQAPLGHTATPGATRPHPKRRRPAGGRAGKQPPPPLPDRARRGKGG